MPHCESETGLFLAEYCISRISPEGSAVSTLMKGLCFVWKENGWTGSGAVT